VDPQGHPQVRKTRGVRRAPFFMYGTNSFAARLRHAVCVGLVVAPFLVKAYVTAPVAGSFVVTNHNTDFLVKMGNFSSRYYQFQNRQIVPIVNCDPKLTNPLITKIYAVLLPVNLVYTNLPVHFYRYPIPGLNAGGWTTDAPVVVYPQPFINNPSEKTNNFLWLQTNNFEHSATFHLGGWGPWIKRFVYPTNFVVPVVQSIYSNTTPATIDLSSNIYFQADKYVFTTNTYVSYWWTNVAYGQLLLSTSEYSAQLTFGAATNSDPNWRNLGVASDYTFTISTFVTNGVYTNYATKYDVALFTSDWDGTNEVYMNAPYTISASNSIMTNVTESVSTRPLITGMDQSGGYTTISGTGGTSGQSYQVQSLGDLASGQWNTNATGTFNSDGTFTSVFTAPIYWVANSNYVSAGWVQPTDIYGNPSGAPFYNSTNGWRIDRVKMSLFRVKVP
jgi:hypothetical protein